MLASDGWRELLLTRLPRGYVCQDLVGFYENTHKHTHNRTLLKGNLVLHEGFPGGTSGKEPACQCRRHKRRGFNAWVRKIPWRRAWQPTPILLPGESHGQRSLVGYSPWGCKESDMTEATCMHAYNPLFKIGKYILLVDVLEHSQEMKEQSIHIYIGW